MWKGRATARLGWNKNTITVVSVCKKVFEGDRRGKGVYVMKQRYKRQKKTPIVVKASARGIAKRVIVTYKKKMTVKFYDVFLVESEMSGIEERQKCDESEAELNTVVSSDRFNTGVCVRRRRKLWLDPYRQGRHLILQRGLDEAFHRGRCHAVRRRKLLHLEIGLKIGLKIGGEGNRWYR